MNQAYNVALGEQTTLAELFELIRGLMAPRLPYLKSVRPVHREPRKGDMPHSRADISNAQRLLGYQPQVGILDGLKGTIDWYAVHLVGEARKEAAHA